MLPSPTSKECSKPINNRKCLPATLREGWPLPVPSQYWPTTVVNKNGKKKSHVSETTNEYLQIPNWGCLHTGKTWSLPSFKLN